MTRVRRRYRAAAALIGSAFLCAAPARAALPPPPIATSVPDEATACLATAIYYEAGFEPREGRAGVAEVILNRLADPRFPKSVCGVVYQGAERRTGCQFTFTCDGSLARPPRPDAWAEAVEIASTALASAPAGFAGGANHYHADYVRPGWAKAMRQTARIGRHLFFSDRAGTAAVALPSPGATPAAAAAEPFAPWGLSLGALSGAR